MSQGENMLAFQICNMPKTSRRFPIANSLAVLLRMSRIRMMWCSKMRIEVSGCGVNLVSLSAWHDIL